MVRFSEYYESVVSQRPEWRRAYINYHNLNRLVCAVRDSSRPPRDPSSRSKRSRRRARSAASRGIETVTRTLAHGVGGIVHGVEHVVQGVGDRVAEAGEAMNNAASRLRGSAALLSKKNKNNAKEDDRDLLLNKGSSGDAAVITITDHSGRSSTLFSTNNGTADELGMQIERDTVVNDRTPLIPQQQQQEASTNSSSAVRRDGPSGPNEMMAVGAQESSHPPSQWTRSYGSTNLTTAAPPLSRSSLVSHEERCRRCAEQRGQDLYTYNSRADHDEAVAVDITPFSLSSPSPPCSSRPKYDQNNTNTNTNTKNSGHFLRVSRAAYTTNTNNTRSSTSTAASKDGRSASVDDGGEDSRSALSSNDALEMDAPDSYSSKATTDNEGDETSSTSDSEEDGGEGEEGASGGDLHDYDQHSTATNPFDSVSSVRKEWGRNVNDGLAEKDDEAKECEEHDGKQRTVRQPPFLHPPTVILRNAQSVDRTRERRVTSASTPPPPPVCPTRGPFSSCSLTLGSGRTPTDLAEEFERKLTIESDKATRFATEALRKYFKYYDDNVAKWRNKKGNQKRTKSNIRHLFNELLQLVQFIETNLLCVKVLVRKYCRARPMGFMSQVLRGELPMLIRATTEPFVDHIQSLLLGGGGKFQNEEEHTMADVKGQQEALSFKTTNRSRGERREEGSAQVDQNVRENRSGRSNINGGSTKSNFIRRDERRDRVSGARGEEEEELEAREALHISPLEMLGSEDEEDRKDYHCVAYSDSPNAAASHVEGEREGGDDARHGGQKKPRPLSSSEKSRSSNFLEEERDASQESRGEGEGDIGLLLGRDRSGTLTSVSISASTATLGLGVRSALTTPLADDEEEWVCNNISSNNYGSAGRSSGSSNATAEIRQRGGGGERGGTHQRQKRRGGAKGGGKRGEYVLTAYVKADGWKRARPLTNSEIEVARLIAEEVLVERLKLTIEKVESLRTIVSALWAEIFTGGDLSMAREHVISGIKRSSPSQAFRVGAISAMIFSCFLYWLHVMLELRPSQEVMDRFHLVFPVFRFIFAIPLVLVAWAFDLYVFRVMKINYLYMLEQKPANSVQWMQCLEFGLGLMLILTIGTDLYVRSELIYTADGYYMGSGSGFPLASPYVFPSIMAIVALSLAFPWKRVLWHSRDALAKVMWQCIRLPFGFVSFVDFFVADWGTSLSQMLVDLSYTGCYFVVLPSSDYGGENSEVCYGFSRRYGLFLALIPFYWRLCQTFLMYRRTKSVVHLINFGKYVSNVVYIVLAILQNNADPRQTAVSLTSLLYIARIFSQFYCFSWDILMDWGWIKGKGRSSMFASNTPYIYATVFDFAARFFFIPANLYLLGPLSKNYVQWLQLVVEVIRRGVWSVFRIENENLNNLEMYRKIDFVPHVVMEEAE